MANICKIEVCFFSEDKAQLKKLKLWLESFREHLKDLESETCIFDSLLETNLENDEKPVYILGWSKWYFRKIELNLFMMKNPEYFKGIKYHYMAVEPSCDIFINTDTEKKYIKEAYYLDGYYMDENGEEHYLESDYYTYEQHDEAIEAIYEWLGQRIPLDKINDYLEEKYEDAYFVFKGL